MHEEIENTYGALNRNIVCPLIFLCFCITFEKYREIHNSQSIVVERSGDTCQFVEKPTKHSRFMI